MLRRCVSTILGKSNVARPYTAALLGQNIILEIAPAVPAACARSLHDLSQVKSALRSTSSIGRTLASAGDLQVRQLSAAAGPNDQAKAGASGNDSGQQQGSAEASKDAAEQSQQKEEAEASNGEDIVKLEELVREKIAEVEEYKEKFARALADMENLRERTARAAERSKQFAIGDFVDDLLDVADTLERAVESVPEEVVKEGKDPETGEPISRERALSILRSFVEGIKLTYHTLDKVFAKHGVYKIVPKVGELLDTSQHEAVFDVPDPSKEPGTIAVVMKKGYTLNGRVIRPAEVGAVRKVT